MQYIKLGETRKETVRFETDCQFLIEVLSPETMGTGIALVAH